MDSRFFGKCSGGNNLNLMKISLPPRKKLTKTDPGDPLNYHYVPLVGYVFKKRLVNTLKLLGSGYNNLLEVGFGSGILLVELDCRAKNVYGVDIHEKISVVQKMADDLGINAKLQKASVLSLPYEDNFFDAVVAVSIFEHLKPLELDKALIEVKRVLSKNGVVVLSFPTRNIITDVFFQTLGWNRKEWNPRVMHPSGHKDIINAAKRHFNIKQMLVFPRHIPVGFSLYCSIKCLKK